MFHSVTTRPMAPPEVCVDHLSFKSQPLLPQPSEDLLQKHYADLSKKPFFPGLIKFMSSGPVVAMVSNK